MTLQEIEILLSGMTLEEKLGQMTQLSPDFFGVEPSMDLTGPMKAMNVTEEMISTMGSTLNAFGAETLIAMQKKHLAADRNKIPLLFMADVVHGYKTAFPIPLAMSCSFNPATFEKAAEIAALESSASGIHLTFSPMADLVRDPRWGRVMESPGEDPYLNRIMVGATVHGFQGENYANPGRIASCVKHFAGYGAAEGGRDYNTVDISPGMLLEYYLAGYKGGIDAGAAMVMTSFNLINRIPATINKWLFRDVLRGILHFEGTTISDYDAVNESIVHGISEDGAMAAELAIKAGNDIEMMSTNYINFGVQLVKEGRLPVALVDEAVRRILILKNKLGLFENPFKDASRENERKFHLCSEHRAAARSIASQSVVLLKNEGVLPLKTDMKIGLAGPFSTTRHLLGGWACDNRAEAVSLYEAVAEKCQGRIIKTAMNGELGPMSAGVFDVEDCVSKAAYELRDCDVVIVAVGENCEDTGEANSKTNLRLSPNQEKLIYALKGSGKRVVTVVFSGRPLEIKPVLSSSDAMVQAWFLGVETGHGLADVLFGDYNPSARLTMSFPHTVGQIPVYYNCFNTGRPLTEQNKNDHYISRYLDCPNEPLFCFGYGLSYSKFEYGTLSVSNGDEIRASIEVTNVSNVAGKETVQLYIRDVKASVVRPLRELKGFEQIYLQPDEKKLVEFVITRDMLKYYNNELEFVFEPGEFDIMVGRNSSDLQAVRILVK